jgi:leucyl/phenylalanyl-tRNA--protein transferase
VASPIGGVVPRAGASAAGGPNPEKYPRRVPVEPPASRWELPDPSIAGPGEDIVGVGADLAPGTLLAAYRAGLFPMRLGRGGALAWWSPDPRGILALDGMIVHRSLRRSARRFRTTIDTAFEGVMRACGDPARPDGWIDESFIEAYVELHRLGWAHSAEVWADDGQGGRPELVGGTYGVAIGGLFAGESMFHRRTDASKVALLGMVEWLRTRGTVLFDVQWCTPHLASLGAVEVSRARYLDLLADAIA